VAKLGAPEFSPAETKDDEFFGRVEIYRRDARVVVPLARRSDARTIELTTDFQGCAAELGICYPVVSARTMVVFGEGKLNQRTHGKQ
jgi:thiol:disulfide interchange protein DsbD